MLTAKIRVETTFSAHHPPEAMPCGPREAIYITASVASPWRLFCAWWRVNLVDEFRKDRKRSGTALVFLLLVGLALVCGVAAVQLVQVDLIARTPVAALAEKADEIKPRALRYDESSWWPALPKEFGTLSFQLRSIIIALAPFVLIGACALLWTKRHLRRIYLIVLSPHEPFPVIDRDLVRTTRAEIFAVRALGKDVRNKYFRVLNDKNLSGSVHSIDTIQLTHANCRSVPAPPHHIDPISYWALIRYATILAFFPKADAGSRGAALDFTLTVYGSFFMLYLLLVCVALFLPAVGWVGTAESTQYPVLMAVAGIAWASALFVVYRKLQRHLAEWERLTLQFPFRGSPLFVYTEPRGQKGRWLPVAPEEFGTETPIVDFGLDQMAFQEFIFGGLLVAYLALLALIK